MPHYLQSPFDRQDEPDEAETNNGFYLFSNAPLDELFPDHGPEGSILAEERPRRPLQPAFVPRKDIDKLHALMANAPRREQFPPFSATTEKPRRKWWGLAADCFYILFQAGAFIMACWIFAMGLPLMFLLLLFGGQMAMLFEFLGSLFSAFPAAAPDAQYAFASNATWCLIGLATLVAAWRLPPFLRRLNAKLAREGEAS